MNNLKIMALEDKCNKQYETIVKLQDEKIDLFKENQQLKEIIDELEKWLKELRSDCFETYSNPKTTDAIREFYYIDVIDKTLKKLKILKGDSNE